MRVGSMNDLGALHELSRSHALRRVPSPILLDIDLDFWGGAAGPLQPPWETPALQACGELFRSYGAAAWGDDRWSQVGNLWAALLGDDDGSGGDGGDGGGGGLNRDRVGRRGGGCGGDAPWSRSALSFCHSHASQLWSNASFYARVGLHSRCHAALATMPTGPPLCEDTTRDPQGKVIFHIYWSSTRPFHRHAAAAPSSLRTATVASAAARPFLSSSSSLA